MGPASSVLRIAITLATVSQHWRAATLLAVKALPSLELRPSGDLAPHHLSPLLAELVAGRPEITLQCPLLATDEAADFIDTAKPKVLRAHGPHSASAEVSQLLASCEGLRNLLCGRGLVPTHLPPHLAFLVVSLYGADASQHLSTILSTVSAQAYLFELKVWLSGCDVVVPQPLPHLSEICYFTLCFEYSPETKLQHFGALQSAAADHVSLSCEVTLIDAESSSVRQRLWAALGEVRFGQLRLSLLECSARATLSAAEVQQLASVHCGELVLIAFLRAPFLVPLLQTLSFAELYCHDRFSARSSTRSWAAFTSQAGVYLLEVTAGAVLTVSGCNATLPVFDKPWALIIRQPSEGVVRGLPLSGFRAGPCGHLVWSNHAVTDMYLRDAYAMLRLD